MTIVDTLGVLLGGDSTPFDKMLDSVDRRLDAFKLRYGLVGVMLQVNGAQLNKTLDVFSSRLTSLKQKLSGFGQDVSLYISAPLTVAAWKGVKAFTEMESALRGLQLQLGKGVDITEFSRFANDMQKEFGVNDASILHMMATLKRFGAEASSLKGTIRLIQGLSLATGQSEYAMLRAVRMMEQGVIMRQMRYVPGIEKSNSIEQNFAAAVEFANKGLRERKDYMESVAGGQLRLNNATHDFWIELGKTIDRGLGLSGVYKKLSETMEGVTGALRSLNPQLASAFVSMGVILIAAGPIAFMIAKWAGTLAYLTKGLSSVFGVLATVSTALLRGISLGGLFTTVLMGIQHAFMMILGTVSRILPVLLVVGTAMAAWKLGRVVADAVGMDKLMDTLMGNDKARARNDAAAALEATPEWQKAHPLSALGKSKNKPATAKTAGVENLLADEGPRFAGAAEFGSKEAWSAAFGNAAVESIQDSSARTADILERMEAMMQEGQIAVPGMGI